MLKHAEDGVRQLAHDRDQGLEFGFATRLEFLVEGAQMRLVLDGNQRRHEERGAHAVLMSRRRSFGVRELALALLFGSLLPAQRRFAGACQQAGSKTRRRQGAALPGGGDTAATAKTSSLTLRARRFTLYADSFMDAA